MRERLCAVKKGKKSQGGLGHCWRVVSGKPFPRLRLRKGSRLLHGGVGLK
jgi:hypothetical protein